MGWKCPRGNHGGRTGMAQKSAARENETTRPNARVHAISPKVEHSRRSGDWAYAVLRRTTSRWTNLRCAPDQEQQSAWAWWHGPERWAGYRVDRGNGGPLAVAWLARSHRHGPSTNQPTSASSTQASPMITTQVVMVPVQRAAAYSGKRPDLGAAVPDRHADDLGLVGLAVAALFGDVAGFEVDQLHRPRSP